MFSFLQKIVRLIRGEVSTNKLIKRGLKVGKNFSRQGHVIIDPPHCWLIEIGDNVTLADGVYILAHDASSKKIIDYTKIGKVKIGNNVFIGARSIILPNVLIGNNVVIGAGSIVTKDIPDNVCVAGNPAKVICTIEDYKKKLKKQMNKEIIFNEEFTLNKIDEDKKKQMQKKLEKGIGFIK